MAGRSYKKSCPPEGLGARIDGAKLKRLIEGHNLISYSILLFGLAFAAIGVVVPGAEILLLLPLFLSLIGAVRVIDVLDLGRVAKTIFVVSLFVPVLNLLVLARLYTKATVVLLASGGKLGFFGART